MRTVEQAQMEASECQGWDQREAAFRGARRAFPPCASSQDAVAEYVRDAEARLRGETPKQPAGKASSEPKPGKAFDRALCTACLLINLNS